MDMMSCMRLHEYYDIMTAGTAGKYEAAKDDDKVGHSSA